jgi:hypothetical protein
MSKQHITSADELTHMLTLLEEGYGGSHMQSSSTSSTPRSPTSQQAMQKLKNIAKGVQSQFSYVMGFIKH